MTTMPVEIFSDHIDDDKESPKSNKSLSKMNKSELYQFSKELVKENQKLKFLNSCGDNVERIEFLEKQYIKLKEQINNLEKENRDLKEKDKKAEEIFKIIEDKIIVHLREEDE